MRLKLSQIIPNSAKSSFWIGFGMSLLVCFFIIFVLSPLTGISKEFGGRGHDSYLDIAENVIKGYGFVCQPKGSLVLCPPFYPLLLSPMTLLPVWLQRPCLIVVQGAMVGCIALLIFRIAQSLFSISTARAAVIIFLLNPWVYWNAKNPMTAITQTFLYILFMFLIGDYFLAVVKDNHTLWGEKRQWVKWLAIGMTGAALILSHGAMLANVVILLFILFIMGIIRRNYQVLAASIIPGLIVIALVAPWTYRNWVAFNRFIPVAGNSGFIYFQGLSHWKISGEAAQRPNENYRAAALRFLGKEGDESCYMQCYGLRDCNIDKEFNEKMKEHIKTQPMVFLKKLLLNSVEYYFPSITYPFLAVKIFSIESLAITVFHLTLWGLAVTLIWHSKKEKMLRMPMLLMLTAIGLYAIWYFPFVTFIGHSLYTMGTIPFLCIMSAAGIVSIVAKIFNPHPSILNPS